MQVMELVALNLGIVDILKELRLCASLSEVVHRVVVCLFFFQYGYFHKHYSKLTSAPGSNHVPVQHTITPNSCH